MTETRTIEVYHDTLGPGVCRGCKASITWAEVVKTGRKMCFTGKPVALRTRHEDATRRLIDEYDFDDNHWKDCPEAKAFKRG